MTGQAIRCEFLNAGGGFSRRVEPDQRTECVGRQNWARIRDSQNAQKRPVVQLSPNVKRTLAIALSQVACKLRVTHHPTDGVGQVRGADDPLANTPQRRRQGKPG